VAAVIIWRRVVSTMVSSQGLASNFGELEKVAANDRDLSSGQYCAVFPSYGRRFAVALTRKAPEPIKRPAAAGDQGRRLHSSRSRRSAAPAGNPAHAQT
jgi:hypothetical protein